MERSGDAVDSYHRYPEDMRLLADAGLNSYRFGLEWARIEPEPGEYSRAALAHYRRMIDTAPPRTSSTPVPTPGPAGPSPARHSPPPPAAKRRSPK
ncbi:beta-glucosidase/6-phospho-beta-glucosidase/beta-galactosidase [Nonomuraea jabiensis]|uniref:Beta-glucosidase/6-phospho-beta-glucosidase/beta-galactosidase n=2 Tax=Nonomuraea jabiensis TaxID=882448 RepID=A0A7W9LGY1_9ACTN|nr:beta-glucosidase/6-phospho-beta-glucosidase/beta-galactosidase [Nonomuraea jabiensis]